MQFNFQFSWLFVWNLSFYAFYASKPILRAVVDSLKTKLTNRACLESRTGRTLSAVETLQRVAAFCVGLLSSRSALRVDFKLLICIITLKQKQLEHVRQCAGITSTVQSLINWQETRRGEDKSGGFWLRVRICSGCEKFCGSAAAI